MRTREEIEKNALGIFTLQVDETSRTTFDMAIKHHKPIPLELEVLLDIRDLLIKDIDMPSKCVDCISKHGYCSKHMPQTTLIVKDKNHD